MRKVWVAGLVLVGLLAWMGSTPATNESATSEESWPAAAARLRAKAQDRDDESRAHEADDALPQHLITVQVRDPSRGVPVLMAPPAFDPARWWPQPETFDHPVAEAYEQVIAGELDEQTWVEQALEAGFGTEDVSLEHPWDAVLALEVERRAALLDRAERARAQREARGASFHATDAWLAGAPEVDELLGLTDALIAEHPNHPAAEYARLYALDAVSQRVTGRGAGGFDPRDQAEAVSLARDMLHHTADPVVAGQAVERLIGLDGDTALTERDLDALEARLDRDPDAAAELEVTALGLDQALRWADPERAESWAARYDDVVAWHCAAADDPRCATHVDNRDEVIAGLGSRRSATAEGWRQAWTLAAYACATEAEPARVELRGQWRDDRWSWQPGFAPDTPYAECVVQRAGEGPTPEPCELVVSVVHWDHLHAARLGLQAAR
ncbi:MAG: hypothetical protein EP330_09805 [Deltaproteobacteria bacterium]|nr:MAG: hypothetical protein EP330_09805 [Deltaproteobacteria bacterium]